MNCRKACNNVTAFLDGAYPLKKQLPLIWHYKHCDSCREELAVSLVLHKAVHALDDEDAEFDFINEDQDEAAMKLLEEAEVRAMREYNYNYHVLGLRIITGWAVLATLILQIMYWKSIGF